MKKQIYLLLGLLMVSVLFVSAAPGDAFIDPVTKSVSGSFDLVVKGDLKAGSVATIDAAFAFDASKLTVSSIDGPAGWTPKSTIDAVAGTATFKVYTFTPKDNGLASGVQSLFTIHLVPKSGVSGDAKVTLTSITAKAGATNNLGGTLSGSTVTIGAAPPPPPPPTTACGNNKQEVGEDCDGSTSASCPSGKEGTVTCANCKNDFSGCKDIKKADPVVPQSNDPTGDDICNTIKGNSGKKLHTQPGYMSKLAKKLKDYFG